MGPRAIPSIAVFSKIDERGIDVPEGLGMKAKFLKGMGSEPIDKDISVTNQLAEGLLSLKSLKVNVDVSLSSVDVN
jgi:hypothetical protein